MRSMNKQLLNDPEWLYAMYWDEGCSSHDIAKIASTTGRTVRKYMRKFGISCRSRGAAISKSFDTHPERRVVSSESAKKQWTDSDYKEMMSEKARKQMNSWWQDPDFREIVTETARAQLTDRWKDPEFRELRIKLSSENLLQLWDDPEFIQMQMEKWEDPEYRKMMSEAISTSAKERWQDPKFKESMSGENNPMWKGGLSFKPYTVEFNYEFKEYIRELQNNQCFVCGKRTKRKLDVHHIDYDKKNTTVENCIALCRNCHMKTNSNREDWILFFEAKEKTL